MSPRWREPCLLPDDLIRQVLKEIRAIMSRIENVRAATDEELETQRIFSGVAKIKATSASLLFEGSPERNNGADPGESEAVLGEAGEGSNGAHRRDSDAADVADVAPAAEITVAPPSSPGGGNKRKDKKAAK